MAEFVLSETNRYWWTVNVHVPDPTAHGSFMVQKLKVLFQPMTREAALSAAEDRTTIDSARDLVEHDAAQIEAVVRGWEGVVDPEGKPVPFSREALRMAIDNSWFRTAVEKAFSESLYGEAARRGN